LTKWSTGFLGIFKQVRETFSYTVSSINTSLSFYSGSKSQAVSYVGGGGGGKEKMVGGGKGLRVRFAFMAF